MKRLLAASLTAFAVLTVTPATADMSSRRDADDVHGALDIKRIVHGHTEGGKLWHKVVMWKRWGARDLAGEDEIRFYFSNDREDRYDEVHASVAVEDGKLAAWVFEYTEGSDYAGVGPSKRIRFVRPDRFSVKIFFSDDLMKNRTGRYTWSVGASYKNSDSDRCRRACFDYAPGHNPDRLEHNL